MLLIDFFVLNLNPISASLKSLGIFVNLKSRQILRLIMIFQQMNLGEQVFKAHLPTQQDSTPSITLSGFRIRKQNYEAMRKYTEAFSIALLTLLSLSLFVGFIMFSSHFLIHPFQ